MSDKTIGTPKSKRRLTHKEKEAKARRLYREALNLYKTKSNNEDARKKGIKKISQAILLSQRYEFFNLKAMFLWSGLSMQFMLDDDIFLSIVNYRRHDRDRDRILALVKKGISIDRDNASAHYINARVLSEMYENHAALAEIEKAFALAPSPNKSYFMLLGEILTNLGRDKDAWVALQEAHAKDPEDLNIMREIRNLQLKLGKPETALEINDEIMASYQHPHLSDQAKKIEILCELRRYDEALELIRDYVKYEPLHYTLATLYENSHLEFIIRVGQLFRDLFIYGNWIVFWACVRCGDLEEANYRLRLLDFRRGLSTDYSSGGPISIEMFGYYHQQTDLEIKQDPESLPTYYDNPEHSKGWTFGVGMLFSLDLPWDQLGLNQFIVLMAKTFGGKGAVAFFEDRLKRIEDKWSVHPDLIKERKAYGEEYYRISLKLELLEEAAAESHKLKPTKNMIFSYLQVSVNKSLVRAINLIVNRNKETERNRILANLSHSIKNMLKSVIDPLINLREELPQKAVIINNAIKGANLIREIVNAINLSFKTTLEELKWDVLNPGVESMTLQDMVVDSLRYSVSNMFDSRYFPAFSEKYFPRSLDNIQYDKIGQKWNEVSRGDVQEIKSFLGKHMFRLELNLDESRDYHVGNEKSSAIKLLILFQEIIFNAVKYASYVPYSDRQVVIMLASHGDKLNLSVKNSFNPKVQAKTTGVGRVVIENFARVLGCEPMISTDSNTYSISLEFINIWRNNAENTVH